MKFGVKTNFVANKERNGVERVYTNVLNYDDEEGDNTSVKQLKYKIPDVEGFEKRLPY